jgi:hypothetical protein
MVELLGVALAVVLVVVVALLFVGGAVGKTSAMPAQIVIDSEEAIEFCAQALPLSVTSVLSYDELRRLLRLHLEWIQAYHWAPESGGAGPIVFEELDAAAYMMERVDVLGLAATRDQVEAVIASHSSYLQVMGAIHLDDPVDVEADLAQFPMLEGPRPASSLDEGTGAPDA